MFPGREWRRVEHGGKTVVGVVIRVPYFSGFAAYDLWNGHRIVRVQNTPDVVSASLLDRLAVETAPDWRDPPNRVLCYNDDCFEFLPVGWHAVYCSNECAWRDA